MNWTVMTSRSPNTRSSITILPLHFGEMVGLIALVFTVVLSTPSKAMAGGNTSLPSYTSSAAAEPEYATLLFIKRTGHPNGASVNNHHDLSRHGLLLRARDDEDPPRPDPD